MISYGWRALPFLKDFALHQLFTLPMVLLLSFGLIPEGAAAVIEPLSDQIQILDRAGNVIPTQGTGHQANEQDEAGAIDVTFTVTHLPTDPGFHDSKIVLLEPVCSNSEETTGCTPYPSPAPGQTRPLAIVCSGDSVTGTCAKKFVSDVLTVDFQMSLGDQETYEVKLLSDFETFDPNVFNATFGVFETGSLQNVTRYFFPEGFVSSDGIPGAALRPGFTVPFNLLVASDMAGTISVPEPSTAILFITSLLGFAVIYHFQRRQLQ